MPTNPPTEGTREQAPGLKQTGGSPTISLPKGGGALRGIGEKFGANPATGTGSMTVPIATSPGRSGFGSQLSLSYDSGAGNGPFGLGWSLSLPAITRKTDQGLPKYNDAEESDVFILSGAEDLVPVFKQDAQGHWIRDAQGKLIIHDDPRTINGVTYRVRRYRPRIEGLFARIERWTNSADATDVFWRSISKDNVTTFYGLPHKKSDGSVDDQHSRIVDPVDPARIFTWLICQSYDDKGNAMRYEYVRENSGGINLAQVHEANRQAPLGSPDPRSANRYLKRIHYGNATSLRAGGQALLALGPDLSQMQWLFEVVFDYGEGHYQLLSAPTDDPQFVRSQPGAPADAWPVRQDPFSSYRAGFEVRTYRLCRRALMFHHFDAELGTPDYLVRSTEFTYREEEIGSFVTSVTQSGYVREPDGRYRKKSLPPVEFDYTRATLNPEVKEVSAESLENLPMGLDGSAYQWVDLDGEGISGILTEQAGAWFYKRNLSPLPETNSSGASAVHARFAAIERVASLPALATASSRHQFLDLAGDGTLDLVEFSGLTPGFYERTEDEDWEPFTPFRSLPNLPWDDPDVRFVDLDGDGHGDVLVTEEEVFTWYRSLGEDGFEPGVRVYQPSEEERGPRLVSDSPTDRIYLADMSGDGLTDLVRIRNGEVCYWPSLGYGRFGAKVTMDNSPWFDALDLFDQKRIRLADIDGSGTTDILYLGADQIAIYRNRSGNSFSDAEYLTAFPRVDNLTSVQAVDLLGNGTACLVWSSPLASDAGRQMRYIDLMGGQKPHLLVNTMNNLGAETVVSYAPSIKFYFKDKLAGKPWITKLPFPVHVVERVETYDHISRNRFVTRYAYHHGYFDGEEREFRGFGMVERWDTEQLAALVGSDAFPAGDNIAGESHVPPVCTKTWFHTGVYLGRDHISDFYAGLLNAADPGEYFREPGLTDVEARALLLPDTILPPDLTLAEEREACRSLKGAMLRQEVYALDGSDKEPYPYTVTEQNFSIRCFQPRGDNRHGVFFTHAREAINYHYERNPADPRIQHALTLEVDDYGNMLKEAAIGYGRRATIRVADAQGQVQQVSNPDLNALAATDQGKQASLLATYTENRVTNAIETADAHRNPLPCEARTFELTGYVPTGPAGRFQSSDLVESDPNVAGRLRHIFLGELPYEQTAAGDKQRRLIELARTLSRKNDLTALCPLGELESLALPGESYKLGFTPGLLSEVYQRLQAGQPLEALIPDPAAVLAGQAGDRGGYVPSQTLKADGRFPNTDADDHWWIPSGRSFFSTDPADSAAAELAEAQQHFFLPRRYRDPFDQDATVSFDAADLLIVETRDALGNRVNVEANDYRVLQPRLVSDPNRNQTAVAFDTLGMVTGTAIMGRPLPATVEGDSLAGFAADLTQVQIDAFHDAADPHANASALLQSATTSIVYDLERFQRTQRANPQDPTKWLPPYAATLARETHASDPLPPQGLKIQISFSYSDGFGREIQKKIQAEPGPLIAGGTTVSPRWVGSGWTIFNNKGKPVRQYEPFFSATHVFEFGVRVGVSPILFYDPVERVVATLHPNHTYEKVVFNPWRQVTWDVNDTVLGDPRTDADIRGYTAGYFASQPASPPAPTWQTWHAQRQGGALGAQEQSAASKAAAHAGTPTTSHFDTLGRPFLTLADNGPDAAQPGQHLLFAARVEFDIEGNQRAVRDAIEQAGDPQGRIVVRYAYDMLGNRIHQLSMEAGERWMLNDVAGKPIRAWDSRGHSFRTEYDPLRRSLRSLVTGADPANPNQELLTERLVYGEQHPEAELRNLRGKLYLHLDQAGSVTAEAHDFKGNPLRASRRLTNGTQYRQTVDWRPVDADHVALPTDANALLDPVALEAVLAPRLETDIYTSRTTYDALNRPVTLTTPHTPAMQPSVIRPGYNEANLLERVDANLRGATANGQPVWTPFVTNIDYDAKGQRQRIDYGNGASTFYEYDPLTFRLVHLLTRRDAAAFPDDCPQPPPDGWHGCQVQNLNYTYDPAGNITHIRDDAQQTIYFRNKRVEPSADYTYDAIYRLTEATSREHLGQIGGAPIPHSHNDAPRVGIDWSANDGNAMGTYIERYVYDAVGNFLEMQHRGNDPVHPGWTRTYAYGETSLIENGTGGAPLKTSNRLSSTSVGNNNPLAERYVYDAHGNMIRMPHLGGAHPAPNMHWDYRDQLHQTDLGGGTTAYYVYDAAGQRVRKVWEKSANLIEERIYLGSFEIFRRRQGAERLERETLHIMDDKQRIALVETRTLDTAGNDASPQQLIRYQLGNHLGSASLELDDQAQIVSYEEYTPYGSTSYQAVRSQTEAPKRYRYTGKERDEETGFNYHTARYYAPWLGKWLNADPLGIKDGLNIYAYSRNNPIRFLDPEGTECNERDLSTCPQGAPPPPPVRTGTLLPSSDANGGGQPIDPPTPELPGRGRNPYQLTLDFVDAIGDSSRQFQLRGGLLAPKYRAASYPVIGSDQIGTTLGRAFKLIWDEHPQLQADVREFGLGIWRRNTAPILVGGAAVLAGTVAAAGAGNQWWPASHVAGLATLIPEQHFNLSQRPASPGDLYFRQGAFSFRDSTAIGRNEGENPVGLFPTLQFRGQYLDRDITFTAGLNARFLPDQQQFRLQESLGLDYNLVRFNIGAYRASLGTEARLNLYQQIDLRPEVRSTSLPAESSVMLQFRITEPPAPRRPSTRLDDRP